jgi:hypothetical protein
MIWFLVGKRRFGKTTAVQKLMTELYVLDHIPERDEPMLPVKLFIPHTLITTRQEWDKVVNYCDNNADNKTVVVEVCDKKVIAGLPFAYCILECSVHDPFLFLPGQPVKTPASPASQETRE